MSRGPNGEWRPRDPNACAVHVGKIATGEIAETYTPPADERRPDPAAGGRARAQKMTPAERSASARVAAAARWPALWALAVLLFLFPALASGQEQEDVTRWQDKQARAAELNRQQPEPQVRNLIPPGRSTSVRSYLGFELHQGGLYEPSIFPTETWLQVACIHADLETPYDRTAHGSGLLRIHALVYDADLNKIHDTTDTDESDEAICNLAYTADTSFVELSRTIGSRASAVAFIAIPSSGQYVEPSKIIYRVLPR